jgi:alpha-D-ribose 1-methylphosphonate 5-triphosphate diphosphatase
MSDAAFAEHVASLREMRDRLGELHEARAVTEARRYGAVLASHDDTTADQVCVSARHGVRMAEFPTTVEAAEACRAHGISVIMGAPNLVRGGSHSGNVAAADLAERDLLDILSSDYVPAALLLGAVKLADIWGDMSRAIATVTANPARAAGLDDRGRIATGMRADLMRFRLHGVQPIPVSVWSQGRRVS